MAKIILEATATITTEKVFAMSNTQFAASVETFISDYAGTPPEGLTATQLNIWKLEQARDKLIDYMRSEIRRLSSRKKLEAQAATMESELAVETNL